MKDLDIIVVGGGPAGMMASISAAARGRRTAIIDKNDEPGRKLLITGGGRCNLTNLCDVETFLENVSCNGEFLYSALYTLPPSSLVDLFEENGLKTTVEDNGRVFPRSGRSMDVRETLRSMMKENGVELLKGEVENVLVEEGRAAGVQLKDGRRLFSTSVVICTGGMTYGETGSTGDGYMIAGKTGHEVKVPVSRLRPLTVMGRDFEGLQGVSVEDVFLHSGKDRVRGPLLVTESGISGPVVFDLDLLFRNRYPLKVMLDLVPGLNKVELEDELISRFAAQPKKKLRNVISDLAPRRLLEVLLRRSGVDPEINCNQVQKERRRSLVEFLKGFPLMVSGGQDRAGMITAGGVSVKDLDPSTMMSRKVRGLFYAGEVVDVHARTGGYNLHIAFSTGYLAGQNC